MDLGEDPIDPTLRSPSSGHELTLEPDGSKTPKEPQSSGGSGPRPGSIPPPPPPDEKIKKDVLPKEVLECMSAFVTIKDAAVNISEKMTGASNATNKALIPKPDVFSAPTAMVSTRQFLQKYGRFTRNNTDLEKFEGLENFLEGGALAVYKLFSHRNPMASFKEICAHLLEELKHLSPDEKSKTFMHRRQASEESVMDYSRDMDLLMCDQELPEEVRAQIYINGLAKPIKDVLVGLPIESLKDAKARALEREMVVKAESARMSELSEIKEKFQAEQESVINMLYNRGGFKRGRRRSSSRGREVNFKNRRDQTPGRSSRSSSRGRASSADSYSSANSYESDDNAKTYFEKKYRRKYDTYKKARGMRRNMQPDRQQDSKGKVNYFKRSNSKDSFDKKKSNRN